MDDAFNWLVDARWTMSPVVWFASACAFHFVIRRVAS